MRTEVMYCDKCGEEIPKVKKKDIFGIEREYYRLGKLNYGYPFEDIDCNKFGMDLCERCAGNINRKMQRLKLEMLYGNDFKITIL